MEAKEAYIVPVFNYDLPSPRVIEYMVVFDNGRDERITERPNYSDSKGIKQLHIAGRFQFAAYAVAFANHLKQGGA